MHIKKLNITNVKTTLKFLRVFLPLMLLTCIGKLSNAQTYNVYVANDQLTTDKIMEFDVYIANTVPQADWALRSYQAGYQFDAAFTNGGTLSGLYVPGSSELEASFGKVWGFTWNVANRVLNQSANTGSSCPGGFMLGSSTGPRKIGRFRVTNTVSFGCAAHNITIRTSGSGFLLLAVTKYTDPTCVASPNNPLTITAGSSLLASSSATTLVASASASPATVPCNGSTNVTVSATGGLPPYVGTGIFPRGAGTWSFTVTDARGVSCGSNASVTITTQPDVTPPNIVSCAPAQSTTGDGGGNANVPDFTGGVVANDNCTPTPSLILTQSPLAGPSVGLGPNTITITVKDASNNTSTCQTTFTVNSACNVSVGTVTSPVSCPSGSDGSVQVTLSGTGTTSTGSYSLDGGPSTPYTSNPFTLSGLSAGLHNISVTTGTPCGASASFTIGTTADVTPPNISACAAPQSVNNVASAPVPDFTGGVTATDNCTATGSLQITQSPLAGTSVGIGPHTITITVTDGSGNFSTCQTTFTVNCNFTVDTIVGPRNACPYMASTGPNASNHATYSIDRRQQRSS